MHEYLNSGNLIEGSRERALYLTYDISIDYMTDAEKLWRRSRGAYELHPERFTPKEILRLSDATLRSLVKHLGSRYPKVLVS